MNNKKMLSLFVVFLFVTCISLSYTLTIYAADPVTSSTSISSSSSSSSSNQTIGDGGAVSLVNYELVAYDSNNNPFNPAQITPGMQLDIKVAMTDTRLTKFPSVTDFDQNSPVAYLNTSAFQRAPGVHHLPQGDSAAAATNVVANESALSYVLVFPVKYSGTGNTFAFDLSYSNANTVIAALPMASFSITLNQCVEKSAESNSGSGSGSSSTTTRGTGFVLKSVSYGSGNIQAGSVFQLDATLLSTNGSYNVENVTVGITPPTEITLSTGSSIYYVGTVAPNQPMDVNFSLLAAADAKDGSYKITINVNGINSNDGAAVTASMDIAVPIVQPERFEVANIKMPEFLTANTDDGSGYGSLSLRNKGKATISNVSARIEGDGLTTDEGDQFIGNIEPGTEKSADFNIHATTPGQIPAKLIITYENAKGEENIITKEFTLTVEDAGDIPIDPGLPIEGVEPPSTGAPVWVWLLVGGGVIVAAIVITVIIVKKRKAKKAAALLEDEEDEDF